MPEKKQRDDFLLEVPLDASGIEGFKPEQTVKVLVQDRKATFGSQVVKFDAKGQARASFTFPENPGALRVIVGPEDASDEELTGLQTLQRNIPTRQWLDKTQLRLPPIRISPFYWHWWLRWCQIFTVRGHVICPDGRPVPGAQVCAYDIDGWFLWSSTQFLGCATTDVDGAFELKFRWCCGWWPWWWWRYRAWELNPVLVKRVGEILERNPLAQLSPALTNQPSLAVFENLLAEEGVVTRGLLEPARVNVLDGVRDSLLRKLSPSPELQTLRLWPWFPWYPWWDCAPDLIFKVTQDCQTPGAVLVDENFGDTRWGSVSPLDVTLIANQNACCLPICTPGQDCPEGECLVIQEVCGHPINEIGGNPGAPVAPVGYLYPGAVSPGTAAYNGDRPFGGLIPVEKNFGDMLNVDYYEIEYHDGVNWVPLPLGAAANFRRRWLETTGFTYGDVAFPFVFISGHNVVESREHNETFGGLGGWNVNRFWIGNRDVLVPLDSTKFSDGTYRFRVVGWQESGGNLVNPRVLPVCGSERENELVLTFDNRVFDSATHAVSHNCGQGVHLCTKEPDTHIVDVRVNGASVGACDTVDAKQGTLEIDFFVDDPDGHLATYSLHAEYGLSLSVNLLNRPSATVIALGGGTQTGWDSVPPKNNAGTYGVALSQGATAPYWHGGRYRLKVDLAEAFPEPCCYQLVLRAWKRTVIGGQAGISFFCEQGYGHHNRTTYAIGVGVCSQS